MSTIQLTFSPTLRDAQLVLGPGRLSDTTAALTTTNASWYEASIAEADALQIRVAGFTANGIGYAIDVVDGTGSAATRWDRAGADAVSPVYDAARTLSLSITATPGDSTARATTTTVTIKINKGGKPDPLFRFGG